MFFYVNTFMIRCIQKYRIMNNYALKNIEYDKYNKKTHLQTSPLEWKSTFATEM